jgi:hypothetical protein
MIRSELFVSAPKMSFVFIGIYQIFHTTFSPPFFSTNLFSTPQFFHKPNHHIAPQLREDFRLWKKLENKYVEQMFAEKSETSLFIGNEYGSTVISLGFG